MQHCALQGALFFALVTLPRAQDTAVAAEKPGRVAKNSSPPWQRALFILLELGFLGAIPFLGYLGFQTLLETRTGTFVEELVPTDPGWQAIVDPSPVVGVVEMDQGRVTGVALIATPGETARGGAVMLFPGSLIVGEKSLESATPEDAIGALEAALRLRIPTTEILDEDRWAAVLGEKSYLVSNPDPVPGDEPGELLVEVGSVEVSSGKAAAFLGRVVAGGDPLARVVRRELLWTEVLSDPPEGVEDTLARLLQTVAAGPHEVTIVPYTDPTSPSLDSELMETLLRRLVPFPAGSIPGDRLKVRVMDRAGGADLDQIAAAVAANGFEVVALGNAPLFDDNPNQLQVPGDLDQQVPNPEIHRQWTNELAERFKAGTVEIDTLSGDTVILLVGAAQAP